MDKKNLTGQIRNKARELGFEFTGFSRAQRLDGEEEHLRNWLKAGFHGGMSYMENHFEKRLDPTQLMPGSKTVISLLHSYYPEEELETGLKIARYAYGKDYHKVLKKKALVLVEQLKVDFPELNARVFVDSAPVMERQWAERSGLGWLGKNTLLINKNRGSYFFLTEILVDLELEYDSPIGDHCGTCTRCLDACPTDAFPQPYVLDASKCISYATIELKDEELPELFNGKMENWIFGCDICQEVCPWNRFSLPHQEERFKPNDELKAMKNDKWQELDEETFNSLFSGSAVKRTKFSGLKRNIRSVDWPKRS